jgi:pimeloyl-ACP methyl ester carboxylesterase
MAQLKKTIKIKVDQVELTGDLFIPQHAKALIIFAHGSGSSRLSPRNRMVANSLQQNNFGTLLFDLLSAEEDLSYANRFNIELLTERLIKTTEWLGSIEETKHLKLGYFGASTGAASALKAAASLPYIYAIVSRGGRPDLAMKDLNRVQAPTLLIVGSLDTDVILLNKEAFAHLSGIKELKIVEGASHLFEEVGTMERVIDLATEWFLRFI